MYKMIKKKRYENALICKEVLLKKAIAKTSKGGIFLLTLMIGLKFYYMNSLYILYIR